MSLALPNSNVIPARQEPDSPRVETSSSNRLMDSLLDKTSLPIELPYTLVPNCVGILYPWPDIKNAEYECIMRIAQASSELHWYALVLDSSYRPISDFNRELYGERWSELLDKKIEFIISLHFDTPRLYDVFTYCTLWNPLQFYHDFGYIKSTMALASHNHFVLWLSIGRRSFASVHRVRYA